MKKITEKVQEAARRLAATKNSKAAYDKCLYDFEMGAYFGYQLAVTRAAEWLQTNVYDDSAYGMAMIEQFRKAINDESNESK